MSLATNGHYLPKRTEGSLSGLFGLNDKPASYAIDLQIDKTVGFDSTAIKHPTWPKLDINSCNVRVEAERFATSRRSSISPVATRSAYAMEPNNASKTVSSRGSLPRLRTLESFCFVRV